MGLLEKGQAFLNRAHKATESVAVTYTRKTDAGVLLTTPTPTIQARHGRVMSSSRQEESGVAVQWSERVYLIEVADLVLGGQPTTPKRGDRITEAGMIWELAPTDTGDPFWRYSDPGRTLYRCYTKRVPA
jgi:hypothetical protein